MINVSIPYYYKSIDWEQFVTEYPPPVEFADTVYKWPRDKIQKLQDERFKRIAEIGWSHPFYKKRWTEAGLEPRNIGGIEDIEKLPVVSSYDFKDEIAALPPYGAHLRDPRELGKETPLKANSTGGTTGMPRPVLYDPVEWEINGLSAARGLFIQGARPGDICQIPNTNSIANFGWCYYIACHHWLGVMPLTTGSGLVTPSRRQIEIARDWGTNIWAAMPDYLTHLPKVAEEELGFDVRDLKTKFIHTGLGPDFSGELRNLLESLWGCDIYELYGTSEIGEACFECREKAGMHFNEDLYYLEILDTHTDEPANPGEPGDLVLTSFYRTNPPLIRYSTKDQTQFFDYGQRCGCGSYLTRMDHLIGRSDDMVKLRGTNVYPSACSDAVSNEPRANNRWLCVVKTVGEGDEMRDEMTVRVEYKDENIDIEDFKRTLEVRLRSDLGVKVAVEPVPLDALKEFSSAGREKKTKYLLDQRGK